MFLSIFFIIAFIICLLCVNHRNIITWSISMYCTGLIMLLASSIMYISSINLYKASNYLDYKLYYYFIAKYMSITEISRIINIGFLIIFVSSIFIYSKFNKSKSRAISAMGALVLFFILLNDPLITSKIYYNMYNPDNIKYFKIWKAYETVLKCYSFGCIMFFMLLPLVTLIKYCVKSKFHIKKKNTIITSIIFGIINFYQIALFVLGPLNIFMPYSVDLFKFPTKEIRFYSTSMTQYILIFGLILVFIIFCFYKPFDNLTIITKKDQRKNLQNLNKNVKMLFHTYKNLFFAIQGLSKQAIDNFETDKEATYENLKYLNTVAEDSVTHITKLLNMMTNVNQDFIHTDIKECINDAVAGIYIPTHIQLSKEYLTDKSLVVANKTHLTDCFVNIIQNSVEAINLKGSESGIIKIKVFDDDDLTIISVYDNGCGINKNIKKHIFDLMFSTKQTVNNCGIGLNYVKKVVNAFHGLLYVKSIYGEYTEFQIAFPKYGKNIN